MRHAGLRSAPPASCSHTRAADNDMSAALRSAFALYVKVNVGGFVGDQKMNSNQFTKLCADAGILEPSGAARQLHAVL
jgi:hypothetical protein